jgi:hypothetical protein
MGIVLFPRYKRDFFIVKYTMLLLFLQSNHDENLYVITHPRIAGINVPKYNFNLGLDANEVGFIYEIIQTRINDDINIALSYFRFSFILELRNIKPTPK